MIKCYTLKSVKLRKYLKPYSMDERESHNGNMQLHFTVKAAELCYNFAEGVPLTTSRSKEPHLQT